MNRTGFDPAKSMDSVFAQSTNAELDFDLMFDQDDQLIDIVAGFNEAGDSLAGVDFETLHQDSYNDKPSDFRDELETNGTAQGASKPEGTFGYKNNSVAVGKGGESDASKFEKNADDEYQKDKLEPKHESFDFDDFFTEADDIETSSPLLEEDEESIDDEDGEIDSMDEAALELLFLEAEEGTAFDKVEDEDAKSRNSKFCNCGKSDCPICGKVEPPAVQKVDLDECGGSCKSGSGSGLEDDEDTDVVDEAALELLFLEAEGGEDAEEEPAKNNKPESDQPDPGDESMDEAALDLLFLEAEEGEDSEEEEPVEEDADERFEPSDTQPEPVYQEPNNGVVDDDGLDEAALDLLFLEAEDGEDDIEEEPAEETEAPVEDEPAESEDDDSMDEVALDILFMEAEGIDKDVKKEVSTDDGDIEDDYVSTVDKNKKKAGKLEYEYSDEELIDSLM